MSDSSASHDTSCAVARLLPGLLFRATWRSIAHVYYLWFVLIFRRLARSSWAATAPSWSSTRRAPPQIKHVILVVARRLLLLLLDVVLFRLSDSRLSIACIEARPAAGPPSSDGGPRGRLGLNSKLAHLNSLRYTINHVDVALIIRHLSMTVNLVLNPHETV
jgi:hypothetical protein